MNDFGAKEAAQALSDIEQIVQRVRQSRIYDIASQIMIAAGVLVLAGNLANFVAPRYAACHLDRRQRADGCERRGALDHGAADDRACRRSISGCLARSCCSTRSASCAASCSATIGPRELGAFWPIYFMLFYCIAGLWFGRAFIIIGIAIIVLTLIGYFLIDGGAFLLWMAAVNGGGLILAGLWMRRI